MFNIVLYEPEIAPNTGNIIRLCANVGAQLHLIEPLGFKPDEKKLRRAGLDYADWDSINIYPGFDQFQQAQKPQRLLTLSTHNNLCYSSVQYQRGDYLLFGPETRGLPPAIRQSVPADQQITLPMVPNNRSLNLSNSVAIVVYEAWRQLGYDGSG
ncbi:MAG: tRNA (cytidine(34)-2'-O)-methyltransferase [Arenicella sp.]|nr:tRNA (cytidine(34)-2'-O)-methyltransferase [Arenicella sp.]